MFTKIVDLATQEKLDLSKIFVANADALTLNTKNSNVFKFGLGGIPDPKEKMAYECFQTVKFSPKR
jgi:hypothetical protein